MSVGLSSALPNSPPRPPPFWAIVSAAWLGPAVLATLNAYVQAHLDARPAEFGAIAWEGVDWLLYGALTPVVFILARRFPLRRGRIGRHLALHVVAALALCVVWAVSGALLRALMVRGPDGALTMRFLVSWMFITLPFGVAVYFAVVGAEHALFYWFEARTRESQLAEARLSALRMQLHPHFLYNSLNAIGVLVRDADTETASRLVEGLGDLLRDVLRTDTPHEIALEDELAFLERYLTVEQIRFSDRLRHRFEVDAQLARAAVPSFVLQPLVENAIRHGISRRADAGEVVISARREGDSLVLAVADDGPGVVAGKPGLGLSNIRARIATLHGEAARLDLAPGPTRGTVATIRLPYRELRRV